MIKGDMIRLFDHVMKVQLRKESLDLVRYDLICTCCSYPRNLVMEVTEETLELMSVLNGFNEK
jgi:hypothetical protein